MGVGVAFSHACDSAPAAISSFPSVGMDLGGQPHGPGSIDSSRPTNHADRHLSPEPTLAFNGAEHNARVHVQGRKGAVKKKPQQSEQDPPRQHWITTTCMSNLSLALTHTGIYFFSSSLRFLKPSLFVCVCRWAAKQLKMLEGNANDLVSSQSKHWEIKLKHPATLKVSFLNVVVWIPCARPCTRASLNLVKSDFTSLNLCEH